jgi:pyruvate/2-oxoacid:ferredoxin oxidoreductase alpha subunit
MKIKATVHIHFAQWPFEEKGEFQVYSCKLDDSSHRIYVGPQEIEIEVPDNYDPRAHQIAALEAEKKRVMAEYQKTVTEITERISRLQAIEHSI